MLDTQKFLFGIKCNNSAYKLFCKRSCFVLLLLFVIFFKEPLQEFDVLIGHVCYGVGVGAVEVDKPKFWDYFCGLSLDRL